MNLLLGGGSQLLRSFIGVLKSDRVLRNSVPEARFSPLLTLFPSVQISFVSFCSDFSAAFRESARDKRQNASNAHCGRRPQHCLYFFPLPHGQGSFRPTFFPVDRVATGDGVDFEDDACAVSESRFTEDSFHRPQYEMLRTVSVIG